MQASIIGISGNTTRPSRTRLLVEAITAEAANLTQARSAVFDLAEIKLDLARAQSAGELKGAAAGVVDAMLAADALIVASPVYKASYTGLFKHLFDLIDPKALIGKPVLMAATGGSERHALVLEHQFQPLFSFFGAAIVPTAIYATEGDLGVAGLVPALRQRVARASLQLKQLMGERRTAPPFLEVA